MGSEQHLLGRHLAANTGAMGTTGSTCQQHLPGSRIFSIAHSQSSESTIFHYLIFLNQLAEYIFPNDLFLYNLKLSQTIQQSPFPIRDAKEDTSRTMGTGRQVRYKHRNTRGNKWGVEAGTPCKNRGHECHLRAASHTDTENWAFENA